MSNIQFNSKEAKGFRTTIERYYNAQHSIKDLINKKSDTIKALQTIIDSDQDDLAAIADGSYKGMRTADEINADIAAQNERIATAKSDYENAKVEQEKRVEEAVKLYSDDLHKAASCVVSGFGSADALGVYRTILAQVLVDAGITDATAENVSRFDFLVMAKSTSAKQCYKTNSLIGIGSKKQSAILFLNGLAEYLASDDVKAIKPFAHKYIPVSERNKKNK